MNRVMRAVTIVIAAALIVFEGVLLLAPGVATAMHANKDTKFQVGDWITQGGYVVGCNCGKKVGPCVCQIASENDR